MRLVTYAFHISMLEPLVPNTISKHEQPPPPPVTIYRDAEFEVTEILDSKIDNHCCTCKLLYLVKWAGYESTDEETLWFSPQSLDMLQKLLLTFIMHTPGLLALSKLHPHSTPNYWTHLNNSLFTPCLMFCFYRKSVHKIFMPKYKKPSINQS
jgi:hypothetical protein